MINKPIFYFSVMTGNYGDMAIRKSIIDAIQKRINVPISYFNIKYDELTEQRIKQLNNEGSCLLIAGSGLYSNANTSSGWYFNCKSELFSKIKIPIILIGLGCNNNLKDDIFNGELSDKTKHSVKLMNDLATISTVRDQRTYDILKNIEVTNHTLMLDPACFLEVPEVKKEKRVAINIAQHAPILGRFDGKAEGSKNREKNIKYFAKISNYLIDKDYKIVFIAHDALEQSLIIDLQKLIPSLEYLNTDNIDTVLKEYARCQFTIAVKMHSCIMSFSSGTPFINIYYDQKSIEFLNMIKCGELGLSVFADYYNELKIRTDMMLKNCDAYIKKIKSIKQTEQINFNNLINKICETIK